MVCEEIRESLMAKVAGSSAEKCCYRILSLVAFILFLAAVLGIVFKASERHTDVEIESLEAFPWPVMYFCMKSKDQSGERLHLQTFPKTASEDGISCARDSALIWSMDLASNDVPTLECLPMKGSEESELARELQSRFKSFSRTATSLNGEDWSCHVLNEDGKLTSTPDVYKQVMFDWYSRVKTGNDFSTEQFVWAGILDPKLRTIAEQKDTFNYFTIPLVNTFAELAFSVDKHVTEDWSNVFTSTAAGGRAKQIGEMAASEQVAEYLKDDAVKLKYNPSLNIKQMSPFVSPPIATARKESATDTDLDRNRLVFAPLYYLSRTVTTRYKTWDELWSAFGGAWATAVLLVSAFFVQKEVKVPPQHPAKQRKQRGSKKSKPGAKPKEEEAEPEVIESVQVFRLRGATSKEEAAKAAWAMAVDAFDAGVANKDSAQEAREAVEAGPVALDVQ